MLIFFQFSLLYSTCGLNKWEESIQFCLTLVPTWIQFHHVCFLSHVQASHKNIEVFWDSLFSKAVLYPDMFDTIEELFIINEMYINIFIFIDFLNYLENTNNVLWSLDFSKIHLNICCFSFHIGLYFVLEDPHNTVWKVRILC